jgi:transposase InsO family protein
MKFQFIELHQEAHSVEMMARLFEVSRSGYYAWKSRPASKRVALNEQLVEEIKQIQEEVKYRYGSPRVTEELRRRGYRVGRNRVARLMRESKLGRRRKRRFRSTTDSKHRFPVAENLLQREFTVSGPNVVWASDLSYVSTADGWLYVCVILDLYSRKVIGWSMGRRMTAELMIQAFIMACMHRNPPEGVIFHSDRGSQYCSEAFRKCLSSHRMRQSMSRVGDPWDNAPVESFFKTLKSELCGDRAFRSRSEARMAIFEYLEVFYNRQRLHSALAYRTPEEYERYFERRAA